MEKLIKEEEEMKLNWPPEKNTFKYAHLNKEEIEKVGYVIAKAEDTIRKKTNNYQQEDRGDR